MSTRPNSLHGGAGVLLAASLLVACAARSELEGDLAVQTQRLARSERGDANGDGSVDVSDGVAILDFLSAGAPLGCANAADTNDDGHVDISDGPYLFNYLFGGGTSIPSHEVACEGPAFPRDDLGPIEQTCALPGGGLHGPALIVNHASRVWDPRRHAKPAIDRLVEAFETAARPVVYVLDYDETTEPAQTAAAQDWYPADHTPSCAIHSTDGVFETSALPITADAVTVVGGLQWECQFRAMCSSIRSYFESASGHTFTVHLPMDAIYTDPGGIPGYTGRTLLENYERAGETYLSQTLVLAGHPHVLCGGIYSRPELNRSLDGDVRLEVRVDETRVESLSTGVGPRTVVLQYWTESSSVP